MSETNTIRLSDYSLVGQDTALAIEKGLAEATWYTSPVARQSLCELLERKNGPALRDTFIWFALILKRCESMVLTDFSGRWQAGAWPASCEWN